MAARIREMNNAVRAELEVLETAGIIDSGQKEKISSLYPAGRWNILLIIRFFSVIGAVAAGAGLFLLLKDFFSTYLILEMTLSAAVVLLFIAGRRLIKKRGMETAGSVLHLLMCFAFSGLTFTLGIHFSTGSGNWPALVGIDAFIYILLAYLLNNRLVFIFSCVNLFTWFGGQTGYVSGWGAYWLGMNYPVRFIAAGGLFTGIGLLHLYGDLPFLKRFRHFNRVYIHFGLLVMNLALWFLSLFGCFEKTITWHNNTGERLIFTLLWLTVSALSLFSGIRRNISTLFSYGLVFLIINLYTFYFQFIASRSSSLWFVHTLIIGGSLLGLGIFLEKRRRGKNTGH